MSRLIFKRDASQTYTGFLSEVTHVPDKGIAIHDGSTEGGILIPQYTSNGENLIRNGNFIIQQNGPGPFLSYPDNGDNNQLTFDGWHYVKGAGTRANLAFSREYVDNEVGDAYGAIRISTVSEGTNPAAFSVLAQQISDARILNGRYVTVSFSARAISGARRIAITTRQNMMQGNTYETFLGNAELEVNWKKFEITGFVDNPGAAQTYGQNHFCALWFWLAAGSDYDSRTGGVSNNDSSVDIANIKMEIGRQATPMQAVSEDDELAKVQRYLEVNNDTQFMHPYAITTPDSKATAYVTFSQRKAKIPTISGITTDHTIAPGTANSVRSKGFNVLATANSASSVARITGWTANAEIDPFDG